MSLAVGERTRSGRVQEATISLELLAPMGRRLLHREALMFPTRLTIPAG
jgi:hypothetical protein